MTTTSKATAVRRLALAAALLFTSVATALAAGVGPAQAAAVHYPWQDPGSARPFTEAAVTQVGLSYCWGGGNAHGPTYGLSSSGCNASTGPGYDCSGLVHYASNRAGLGWPDQTAHGYSGRGTTVTTGPRPGDLLFWDWNGDRTYDHVAIFLGENRDNRVVEFVEANGAQGLNASTGHRVKISAYRGAHLIKRIY
ncbi:MAG TPA: NlpC/P60 family protein [Pilimelia sp.]|nr:NlpC/P60 family protein [Pilimelia sp.]